MSFLIPLIISQWAYSDLGMLEYEYQRLLELGDSSAYELIPDLTYTIRIHEGLYSLRQVPYLIDHLHYERERGNYDGVARIEGHLHFIVGRNDSIEDKRRAILAYVWLPENKECTEREGWRPTKQTQFCIAQREMLAESFIYATKTQVQIAEQTGEAGDWKAVSDLALITSYHVLGIAGPPTLLEIEADEHGFTAYHAENHEIPERYRSQTWLQLSREAEERME